MTDVRRSMCRCLRRASGLALILGLAIVHQSMPAQAIPITYTFGGTGTGDVGGTPFTNVPYTITLSGDTSGIIPFVVPVVGYPAVTNPTTGTMTVQGIGVATITEPSVRACSADGKPKESADWQVVPTRVQRRASIGSGAVILAGVTVGEGAVVGAGNVVTEDVAPRVVVAGNPARVIRTLAACEAP